MHCCPSTGEDRFSFYHIESCVFLIWRTVPSVKGFEAAGFAFPWFLKEQGSAATESSDLQAKYSWRGLRERRAGLIILLIILLITSEALGRC